MTELMTEKENRFYRTKEAEPIDNSEGPTMIGLIEGATAQRIFDLWYAKLLEEARAEIGRTMALPDVDLMKCSESYRRFVEECVAAMMRRPAVEWPSWMQYRAVALKPAKPRPKVYYVTLSDPLTGRRRSVPRIAHE